MQDPNRLDSDLLRRLEQALTDPPPMDRAAERALFAKIVDSPVSGFDRWASIRARYRSPRILAIGLTAAVLVLGLWRWPRPDSDLVKPDEVELSNGEEGFVVDLWSHVLTEETDDSTF